jgi:hypothetical protein
VYFVVNSSLLRFRFVVASRYRTVKPLWRGQSKGRVDLGGLPSRPPTEPDVRVKGIWLFIS